MDQALMEVATGTFSLDHALEDTLMTGFAYASQEQTKNMTKELDVYNFEVSTLIGARASHAQWQGKVYTESELVSVCGLGEVTGLLGTNCYHNYYMFFEGVSKRAYTDEQLEQWKDDTPTSYEGKEYTNYEARQRMRQMETNMRAQKEKIKLLKEGGASEDAIKEAQARYRKQMSEYEKFSDAMNLKTQKERITIGDGKTMKGLRGLASNNKNTPLYNPEEVIKRGHLTKVDDEIKMKVLKAYEKTIVNKDVEHMIVITKAGEVYEVVGGASRVHPELIGKEKLDGAFVTHNHPKDETEYTLSDDDVGFLFDYKLSKLRGVDYMFEYELDWEFDGSNIDEDADDWFNEYNCRHGVTCLNCDNKKLRYRRYKK